MAGREPVKSQRTCPEIIGKKPDGTDQICGLVHIAVISDMCPEHLQKAAAAFWFIFDDGTVPDTTPAPENPPSPKPPKQKTVKRPRQRKIVRSQ